jgi:hypothetical protein
MSAPEQTLGGPEIEVVAKATRRRFTLEYKRKIVREADGCKTPGAVARWCAARDCTPLISRHGMRHASGAIWRGYERSGGRRLGSRTRATRSSSSRRANSRGGNTAPRGRGSG